MDRLCNEKQKQKLQLASNDHNIGFCEQTHPLTDQSCQPDPAQSVDGNLQLDTEKAALESVPDASDTRQKWSSQFDFLFSCIGYAVGFGAFWRFPYLCMRNSGGAFLIPYFTFLLLCGMPLFFLELSIGQFSGLSPLLIWNICPLFKGIGWSMVIMSGICTIYYNLIIAWALYFLVMSFTAELPWATCNNTWNTPQCSERSSTLNSTATDDKMMSNITAANLTVPCYYYNGNASIPDFTCNSASVEGDIQLKKLSPAEEFWTYNVLDLSSGIDELGPVRWQLMLCLLAAWFLVFLCLSKGIRSSGKVVYVTATIPYIFLTLILIRGVLLPGAVDGLLFYLTPDFEKLLSLNVWAEACLQIFYSLGPAWGGLITMSSYNKFNNNCLRDSVIVSLTCCGSSFYAGFVCFSVLGYMAYEAGVNVSDVVTSGPGLVFTVYPEAITKLPISPLWAICFFLMLLTLGLDSQFGMMETCTSGFIDEFPKLLRRHRSLFTALCAAVQFLVGLPLVTRGGMYLFQILDWYAAAFSAMVIAFLECIVLAWIYKVDRLYNDIEMMLGSKPSRWWKFCWCFITPLTMSAMVIYSAVRMAPPTYGDYKYPDWAIGLGWIVAMCSIAPMPAIALYRIIRADGPLLTRIKMLLKPTDEWGPNSDEHRSLYNSKYRESCQHSTTLL